MLKMEFTLALVALFTLFVYPSVAAPANDGAEVTPRFPSCAGSGLAVAFYRAYSPKVIDHFYTTNATEYKIATTTGGYNAEGRVGRIFPSPQPLTTPLYRLFNPTLYDHFYTILMVEKTDAIRLHGYKSEGIAGYVYVNQDCGSVPLYRFYNHQATSHFYTLSEPEGGHAEQKLNNGYEGIAAYIYNV